MVSSRPNLVGSFVKAAAMMQEASEATTLIDTGLFTPERRRLQSMIDALCVSMGEIQGRQCHGFMWKGIPYTPTQALIKHLKGEMPSLSFKLTKDMLEYEKTREILELDRKQILQLLFKLLYQCNNKQEIFDALPDCLHKFVPGYGEQRYLPQHHYFFNQDRVQREYEKILPKIEMYSVAGLIY